VRCAVQDRDDAYHARRRNRILSPDRGGDAFAGEQPTRSYRDIMLEAQVDKERDALLRKAARIEKERAENGDAAPSVSLSAAAAAASESGSKKRPRSGDDSGASGSSVKAESSDGNGHAATDTMSAPRPMGGSSSSASADGGAAAGAGGGSSGTGSEWDKPPTAPPARRRNRWDATPDVASGAAGGATPAHPSTGWETPSVSGTAVPATPRKRSRWDETPVTNSGGPVAATPLVGSGTFDGMATPVIDGSGGMTMIPMTGDIANQQRYDREMEERNRPLTDDELDAMFPPKGYKILEPPANYQPVRSMHSRLLATPTPLSNTSGFIIPQTPAPQDYGVNTAVTEAGGVPIVKQDDLTFFGKLLEEKEGDDLSAKERRIMTLLLRIKNGTPPQRKNALRTITEKARELGAGPLFNQLLPILMSPTLEDQERHLMVKVIDRVLYKLDDLVRPFVRKILTVIQPMLIDVDYYARVEGREIISNLSKAAGLATMISTMRPDIDHLDEFVRNTTARAFAVVASALGIPALLPFLKAVCQSKKSWQARHTGIKICQQIAILMGCAVLPHLKMLVDIVVPGLNDEQQKVRTITGLSIAALAEAAHPYGIESFESALRPLWEGVGVHRGKGLASFLKAVGHIIPLMDAHYAAYYTKEVMPIVCREFQSPDEEMKKIVLKVVQQCVSTDGVDATYIRQQILPEFFKHFWVRRMALDPRNAKPLVETTVELANKVCAAGCCVCVGARGCVFARVRVFEYVCTCVCTCICVCVCARICACGVHACTRVHECGVPPLSRDRVCTPLPRRTASHCPCAVRRWACLRSSDRGRAVRCRASWTSSPTSLSRSGRWRWRPSTRCCRTSALRTSTRGSRRSSSTACCTRSSTRRARRRTPSSRASAPSSTRWARA
jgi:splicing factor 3B subunit 1